MYSISGARGPPLYVREMTSELENLQENNQSLARPSSCDFVLSDNPESPTHSEEIEDQPVSFWDRKGVIKMDPSSDDRCTHTTVPPSAMMTLAMELLVSNRGKASKMFRKAKIKAQDGTADEDEKESNLPNLWVVPEPDTSSRNNSPSTASHLKPNLANADFVFQRTSSPESQANSPDHACKAELESDEIATLANITVVDLVGSADHVIVYSDSEDEDEEKKNKKSKGIYLANDDAQEDEEVNKSEHQQKSTPPNLPIIANAKTSKTSSPNPISRYSKDIKIDSHAIGVDRNSTKLPISNRKARSTGLCSNILGNTAHQPLLDISKSLNCDVKSEMQARRSCDLPLRGDSGDLMSHSATPRTMQVSPEFDTSLKALQMTDRDAVKLKGDHSHCAERTSTTCDIESKDKVQLSEQHQLFKHEKKGANLLCNEDLPGDFSDGSAHSLDKKSIFDGQLRGEYKFVSSNPAKVCNGPGIGNRARDGKNPRSRSQCVLPISTGKSTSTAQQARRVSPIRVCNEQAYRECETSSSGSYYSTTNSMNSPSPDISFSNLNSTHTEAGNALSAESRSLSSSLLSLSSLESLSSASLHLSSLASEKMSVASCISITPDSVDFQERKTSRQGTRSLNDSTFSCYPGRPPLKESLSWQSNPLVTMSSDGVSASARSPINSSNGCAVGENIALRQSYITEENISDANASSYSSRESIETAGLLQSSRHSHANVTAGCNVAAGSNVKPRSPSRKVICEYTEVFPILEEGKSPGPIISQAVFQDENDSTVATPVLHLKKKVKYCPDCRSKMSLCCCVRRKAPPGNGGSGAKNVGENSRKFSNIITGSRSRSLPAPVVGSNEWKVTNAAKAYEDAKAETVEKSQPSTGDKQTETITPTKATKAHLSMVREEEEEYEENENDISSETQIKSTYDLEAKVTTKSHRDGCRITLSPIQSPTDDNAHFTFTTAQRQNDLSEFNARSIAKENNLVLNDMAGTRRMVISNSSSPTQPPTCDRNVDEGVVMSKQVPQEQLEFGERFHQVDRKVENKNPLVNVVGGSKITLKRNELANSNTTTAAAAAACTISKGGLDELFETVGDITSYKNSHDKSVTCESKQMILTNESDIKLTDCALSQSKPEKSVNVATASQLEATALDSTHDVNDRYANYRCTNADRRSESPNVVSGRIVICNDTSSVSHHADSHSDLNITERQNHRIETSLPRETSQEPSHQRVKDTNVSAEQDKRPHVELERVVCEPNIVKFEGRTILQVTTPHRPSGKTELSRSVSAEPAINRSESSIYRSFPSSTVSSDSEMPAMSPTPQSSSPRPVYSSSISLSLRPVRIRPGRDSPAYVTKTSSIANRSPSPKVISVGKHAHPEYRKWVQEWTTSTDAASVESKAMFREQVQDYERRDAESRLTPTRMHRTDVSVRPPTGATDRQTSSPVNVRYVQITRSEHENDGYEQGYFQNDGLRTIHHKAENEEGMVGNQDSPDERGVQAPPHSATDDEDFCGVVEVPTMKVKDIRAKYKVRDYENYAKPRSLSCTSSNGSRIGSEEITRRATTGSQSEFDYSDNIVQSDHVVAQQVMNMFKGALDVEKELAVFEEEAQHPHEEPDYQLSPSMQNGHVTTNVKVTHEKEPVQTHVQVALKPGKLNTSVWPPAQETECNNNNNPHTDIKTSVEQMKTEAKEVASFDESLDQFYDVLNDLTA